MGINQAEFNNQMTMLANSINTKAGTSGSKNILQLISAVESIDAGGSTVVLQDKSVTSSTSQQNITADTGYTALRRVVVAAVTASIDANIQAENIKRGKSILGVNGTLDAGITPSGSTTITANGTHDVTNYASAIVNVPSSAKTEQTKTVALAMSTGNQIVTPDTNKVLSQVTITKPATLLSGNIKNGVNIGGVVGNALVTTITVNQDNSIDLTIA